jgi:hypothetical protein
VCPVFTDKHCQRDSEKPEEYPKSSRAPEASGWSCAAVLIFEIFVVMHNDLLLFEVVPFGAL